MAVLDYPDDGGEALWLHSGGRLHQLIDDSSSLGAFSDPHLNNHGTVAFRAGNPEDEFRQAIYVLSGGTLRRVAGGNAEFFSFSDPGVNDRGQLAFWATLEDGRVGIYIATPR